MSSTASIKISATVDDSIVDGEGYRFTIFTQGCPHHCPGCQNPQTHDFANGKTITVDELFNTISKNPLLSGVTFSGGEPFLQAQPLALLGAKLHTCGLDITTYTGYTLEQLQNSQNNYIRELLAVTDVLIDGPFIIEKRDLTLTFRGSSNQRIIDMNKTRDTGSIALKIFD